MLLLTAACGSDPAPDLLGDSTASPSPAAGDPSEVRALLTARADAVRDGDRRAFLGQVASGTGLAEKAFRAEQARLFDNLRRLPLGDLTFAATTDGQITRTLRIRGFDDGAHTGPAGFAVRPVGGRLRVVPPAAGQDATEPWDLTSVEVAADPERDVLLVHDGLTGDRTEEIVSAVHEGIDDVSAVVPFTWSRTAVVYAFDDDQVLSSYTGLPGANLRHLGALTFPVPATSSVDRSTSSAAPVGQRIALLPGALEVSGDELRRVVRHELTHAAVGDRDDHVPTWLAEGLAEHVASIDTPRRDLRIPTAAVEAARSGPLTLPTSESFNDADQDLHYAVAWMACDWLADQQGEATLWTLLTAMSDARVGRDGLGDASDEDSRSAEEVLNEVTGLASYQLADGARERILDLFG